MNVMWQQLLLTKSIRIRKTGKIFREKIQNQISAFNKRNNQYYENNDEDNNPNQN
jgi:hypothetical protein